MRTPRVLLLGLLAVAMLGFPGPARASTGGHVLLPSGNPAVAKAEYTRFGSNGVTGYTFRLPAGSDDKAYTLTALHGMTGLEDFDAWFYEDDDGEPGALCGTVDFQQNGPVESGTVCPNAQRGAWAVIVLFAGADGTFVFNV